MARKRLTDAQVRNLKVKPERYEVFGGDGLGVRIGPSGIKAWILVAHTHDGRSRRFTLGRYRENTDDDGSQEPGTNGENEQVGVQVGQHLYLTLAEANTVAARFRNLLSQGVDPGEQKHLQQLRRRKAPTVEALCREYIDKHARPRKRSWRDDERYLERFVMPAWGALKAEDVTRRMVIDLLDQVNTDTPTTANRLLAVVRKMFNFAIQRAIVETSPCLQVKAPARERQRDRILAEKELRTFWRALLNVRPPKEAFDTEKYSPMSETTALALRLQLLTAQRIGEVVGAPWAEFDLQGGWWTIAAERSKNGLAHRVPLTAAALEVLKRARVLSADSAFAFPGKRFSDPERQRDEPIRYGVCDYALRRTREHCGLDHFTPHDLRRTAASYMTSARVPRLHVRKVLNHAERGVTAVYDRHSYDPEKREALETWARELARIVLRKGKGAIKRGDDS
jgi:integrase